MRGETQCRRLFIRIRSRNSQRSSILPCIISAALFLSYCFHATPAAASSPPPSALEIRIDQGEILLWERGKSPVLLVPVRAGDGWLSLAKRFSGTTATAPQIRRANPRLRHPLRDRSISIPLEMLRGDLRLKTARRLFPTDRRTPLGYRHWILDPFGDGSESWKWLGLFFCGRDCSRELKRANPEMTRHGLHRARPFHIPEPLLLPVFRRLQVKPVPTPGPRPTSGPDPVKKPTETPQKTATPVSARPTPPAATPPSGALEYGIDKKGAYALYRLHRGEALYSAVVIRFTGQLHAKQVIATAREIAKRSGIPDVTDIPVGHPIKIPLDLLLPRFLPPKDPRRLAWEENRKELAAFLEVVRDEDLSGVEIILDAGHGGLVLEVLHHAGDLGVQREGHGRIGGVEAGEVGGLVVGVQGVVRQVDGVRVLVAGAVVAAASRG